MYGMMDKFDIDPIQIIFQHNNIDVHIAKIV